jgi:diadenosine tetraphosphate (Ap4A) HIT family hydrolase
VDSPYCSVPAARIWIDAERAIAFAADAPATEGHIVIAHKQRVPSIHAPPMAAQRGVWDLVGEVRGRLRSGLVPDGVFNIGFDELGKHAAVHVVPRRAGDDVELPEGVWVRDDGVTA